MCAIDEETIMTGVARPTRIQHHSRLSYDRMMIHFTELEEKGMIQRTTGRVVSITVKGREFVIIHCNTLKTYYQYITYDLALTRIEHWIRSLLQIAMQII